MSSNIKVIHFQRKPRAGFNYSIESIFENLRYQLRNKVDFSVAISSCFNDGYLSKIYNIIEATFRQKRNALSHITGEVHFLNFFMRKEKVLLSIHDCRFMQRKKGLAKVLMQYGYLKWPVAKSAYVVSVSESTKKDIIKYTNCAAEKIKVIPVSVSEIFKPASKVFNKSCPVILHIGDAPNKNLSRLIDAIKEIKCQLVIIGNPAENNLKKLTAYKINYCIKSNLSLHELYNEYINCDIVAFVSTFEGFGMPIAEANCVERVVLTSNVSSMPEVAANAACLVNPFNVTEIKHGILKLINDAVYREQLIVNGRTNKHRFNSKTIAEQYYSLYMEMQKNKATIINE